METTQFPIAYVHCIVPKNIHTLPTKARKETELLMAMGRPNGGNFRGGGGGGGGFLFDFFSLGLQDKTVVTINTESSGYLVYSAVKC